MLKIWGRNTSSNVQKVMWAVGELGLEHERIDVGGAFGKTKEEPYLSMNPNSLVPTLEEDGFILWVEQHRALPRAPRRFRNSGAARCKECALASQWMDWQLSVAGPAIRDAFWGLIRTPPEKQDHAAIKTSQAATVEAMKIFDAQLGKTRYAAGDAFSMGDIPVGIMAYRFWKLCPDRPKLANLERWYKDIESRKAFQDHVRAVPIT